MLQPGHRDVNSLTLPNSLPFPVLYLHIYLKGRTSCERLKHALSLSLYLSLSLSCLLISCTRGHLCQVRCFFQLYVGGVRRHVAALFAECARRVSAKYIYRVSPTPRRPGSSTICVGDTHMFHWLHGVRLCADSPGDASGYVT